MRKSGDTVVGEEAPSREREFAAKLDALSRAYAVAEFDMAGRIVATNANMAALLGYAADALIGLPHERVLRGAAAAPAAAQDLWSELRAGRDVADEHVWVAADGRDIWLQSFYNVVLDIAGGPVGVVMYGVDISRDKLERADHAAQVAAIGKSQAVIEFDLDGTVLSANDHFLAAFGFEREDIVGRHHSMFVDPETRGGAAYAEFWATLRRGEFAAGEYKRIGKAGREVWIQATYNPILDLNGRPFKVVKYAADVTEAKRSNADIQGQIDAIGKSQAVIEFDLDGFVLWANDRYLDVTGYALEEVQGRHHRMFMEPDEVRRPAYEDFWSTLRRGEFLSGEFRRLGKDGRQLWLQASYNPIRDMNGRPFKIVKYASDTTDAVQRREAEQTLKATAAAAEAAAAAKGDFMANMSHELRTPLTSIIGFARVLSQEPALSDTHKSQVDLIRTAGETLLTVVNDILDFSRLEAGAVVLSMAPVRVLDIVRSVVDLLAPARPDLDVSYDVEPGVVVQADASRLRQVLLNLVGNAVKFTETGGVAVRVSLRAGGEGDGVLDVTVEDTGVGVPEADIPHLFERFTQVDNSVSRRFGGAGLGLAICRDLVRLMGGEIGARNNEGPGATFWMRIPTQIAVVTEDAETTSASAPERPLSILMADDHAANRTLVATLLQPFQVRLDLVTNGAEAVEAATSHIYDVVLMDLQMPVMDGFTATRAIRALKGVRGQVPIIALTANVLPDQVAKCLQAGMQAHVPKPIDLDALLYAIERFAIAQEPEEPGAMLA